MGLLAVLLVRAAVADVRAHDDERRTLGLCLCAFDGLVQRIQILHVADELHVPAVPFETEPRVVAEGEIGVAFDRYVIVIVEADQPTQFVVAGERCGFVRDPFHEITVTRDEIRVVIDDPLRAIEYSGRVCFRDRHSDCIAESLSERTGRRFDARCVSVLGMSGCLAVQLTKIPDVVERQVVASEIEDAVQQHRCMAARQNESVTVGPVRIGRIVAQVARP